ncbi:MAG: hypothetical protein F4206_02655 [Gammaproteobacteria bacterium]|nr:hypothetical protein [Gammaproteobacteria bacterium]MYG65619.1 hypothetical protein [Gammaproteobacteria bacterium]
MDSPSAQHAAPKAHLVYMDRTRERPMSGETAGDEHLDDRDDPETAARGCAMVAIGGVMVGPRQ